MAALTDLTLSQARDGLAAGEFSAIELTEAHIAASEALRDLNCYILETPDAARAMAQAADDRRVRGEGGALNGLPIAITVSPIMRSLELPRAATGRRVGGFWIFKTARSLL